MADAKISALNALTTADDADLFAVVDTSATETKKITKANMLSPIVISGANVGIGIAPSAKLHVNGDSEINSLTIGRGAGNNTSNTVFGRLAFGNNTTGVSNTAVGFESLFSNTTGIGNTAISSDALYSNTTGTSNTAVGFNALYSNTTGVNNAATGRDALRENTTGTNNAAVGMQSLYSNTTGTSNTAVGFNALYSNTTGVNNAATGRDALRENTTGTNNAAFGSQSLYNNTTGSNNAATGRDALRENTTGANNAAVGTQSLVRNTTGVDNTAVGTTAGDIITTGNRNVLIGRGPDPSAEDGDDQIVIGHALTGKGNDTAYVGGTNGAYNEKNVTTWETTSDERIKKNIEDNNTGLDILSQIQVRNFEYRTPDEITNLPSHAAIEKDGVQLGVIAQEIQKVLPECVSENSTGVLSVNTDPLVWYLINAVKELKAEIQAMKGN